MPAPRIRFRIDFADSANVGPGKIDLLEAIDRCGSLSKAARQLKMSYRRAWLLLASVNDAFSAPATVATTGGRGGGGVELTKFGLILIKSYRGLEADIKRLSSRRLRAILPNVAGKKSTRAPQRRRPISQSLR